MAKETDNNNNSNNDTAKKSPVNPGLGQLKALLLQQGFSKQIASLGDNTWLDKMLRAGIIKAPNGKTFDAEFKNDAEREEFAKQLTQLKEFVIADNRTGKYSSFEKNKDGTYKKNPVKVPEPPIRPLFILMFLAFCGFKIPSVERYYQERQQYAANKAKDIFGQKIAEDSIKEFEKDVKEYLINRDAPEKYRQERLKDELKKQKEIEKEQKNLDKKRLKLEKDAKKLAEKQEKLNKEKAADTEKKKEKALEKRQKKLDEQAQKIKGETEALQASQKNLDALRQKNQIRLQRLNKPLNKTEQVAPKTPQPKKEAPEVKPNAPEAQQNNPEVKPIAPEAQQNNPEVKPNAPEAQQNNPEVNKPVEEKQKVQEQIKNEAIEDNTDKQNNNEVLPNAPLSELNEAPPVTEIKNGIDIPNVIADEIAEDDFEKKINDIGEGGLFSEEDVKEELEADREFEELESKINDIGDGGLFPEDEADEAVKDNDGIDDIDKQIDFLGEDGLFPDEDEAAVEEQKPQKSGLEEDFVVGSINDVLDDDDEVSAEADMDEPKPNSPLSELDEAENKKEAENDIDIPKPKAEDEAVNKSDNSSSVLDDEAKEYLSNKMKELKGLMKNVDEKSPLGLANATAQSSIEKLLSGSKDNSDSLADEMRDVVGALAIFQRMKNTSENKEKEEKLHLTKALSDNPDDERTKKAIGKLMRGVKQFAEGPLKDILGDKPFENFKKYIKDDKALESLGNKALNTIKKDKSSLVKEGSIIFEKIFKEPGKDTWSPMPGAKPEEVARSLERLRKLPPDDKLFKELSKADSSVPVSPDKRNRQLAGIIGKINETIDVQKNSNDPLISKISKLAVREMKHLLSGGLPDSPSSDRYPQQIENLKHASGYIVALQSLLNDKNGELHKALGKDEKRFDKFISAIMDNQALSDLCSFNKDKVLGVMTKTGENKSFISMLSNEVAKRDELGLPESAQRFGALFRDSAKGEWKELPGATTKEINDAYMKLLGNPYTRNFVLGKNSPELSVPQFNLSKNSSVAV